MPTTKRATKKKNEEVVIVTDLGRQQPQAVDFEEVVIGACLIEQDAFGQIADYLKQQGWNIDTGVYNWAAIEVADREEYEAVLDDWKEAKKLIKK